jgi:hypothetical protein
MEEKREKETMHEKIPRYVRIHSLSWLLVLIDMTRSGKPKGFISAATFRYVQEDMMAMAEKGYDARQTMLMIDDSLTPRKSKMKTRRHPKIRVSMIDANIKRMDTVLLLVQSVPASP